MGNRDLFLGKIIEIRAALSAELYNCALIMALTLPDICGKVEYPKENAKKRYVEWFSVYAKPFFTVSATKFPEETPVDVTWLSPEECWALRCAVFHSGNYETEYIKLTDIRIHAHKRNEKNYSHMSRDSRYADLDGILLCENLCVAAEQYYKGIKEKSRFNVDEIRIDTW